MHTFYKHLDRVLTTVLIVLVVGMVCCITAEIVLNAVIQPVGSHLLEYDEDKPDNAYQGFLKGMMGMVAKISAPINTLSQTILVWIGILGSALAFRLRSHLGVDALVRIYPPKVRLILDYVSTVLVGLFSLTVLVIGGWMVCYKAFSMGSKMPGFEALNRGWFYLVLIFTGLLNLIYCVYHFYHPTPVSGREQTEEGTQTS